VATTDSKAWPVLKQFARENRKNPTQSEDTLWQAVRNQKLGYKIRRQHAIAGYIVDFVCIPEKWVIEVDGDYHSEPDFVKYDQSRTEFLNEHGFQVLRFTNEEVETNLAKVLSTIKNNLEKMKGSSPLEKGPGEEVDLHRPFVDHITLVSPSGKPMKRESDLIDVWFDSGAMPYAQWHYPFENQDKILSSYSSSPLEKGPGVEVKRTAFPADFISEGVDQTRGWFFTLHAIASMLSDEPEFGEKLSPAFLNVVSTGLVLDKDGEKMSKRKGNVINPFEAIRNYGPDPVRWYMITNSNPWDNLRFNLDGVTEVRNKFFGTLANTYNFFALYANIDGFKINESQRVPKEKLTELDRWILSKLNSLIGEVDGYYADYEPTKAGRAIQDFVCDQLSNWYVRLGRKRFWRGEMTENKQAAYETLQHCLLVVSQLMSPIAPFFAEKIYKSLTDGIRPEAKNNQTPLRWESVHLTEFTLPDASWIDKDLEAAMELAQRTSSLVHSLRKNHKLKVRQPLARMLMPVPPVSGFKEMLGQVEELILSEVNIKKLELIEDTSGLVEKSAKPNFKKLGKSLGPKLKAFGELVAGLTQSKINQFEKFGLEIDLDGEKMFLKDDDLEIRSENISGWVVANDQEITVALDLALTDELKMEGIARDVVNRVQNQRKDMGLDVLDRIVIRFAKTNNDLITKALEANREYICTETQANALEFSEGHTLDQLLELEDFSLAFGIEKS
jgi:isoleucyl-tRNA synthetase